jgi:hypothetical protein
VAKDLLARRGPRLFGQLLLIVSLVRVLLILILGFVGVL